MSPTRSSLNITMAIWKALFLREALTRLFGRRAAWLWLLVEPIYHVVYLMIIFTVIRMNNINGVDTPLWIMIGILSYFMFQRTGLQVMNAISANKALFTYRQVKPVDTVLVRSALECFLMVLISIIVFAGALLFGYASWPTDPLAVFVAFFAMWMLGLGYGLSTSVVIVLVPELEKIIGMVMMPLFILSGVMFPISSIPAPYQKLLMLNPVAHGLELARLGFSSIYQQSSELNIFYTFGVALLAIFLGLALHTRYSEELMAQ